MTGGLSGRGLAGPGSWREDSDMVSSEHMLVYRLDSSSTGSRLLA